MRKSMIVWVLLSVVLGGCASTKVNKAKDRQAAPDRLIITDLVNTLQQVPALHPQSTRLRMLQPEHQFGQTLLSVLSDAGYLVQIVGSGEGAGYVNFRVTDRHQSESGVSNTYQIMIGSVGVKRDYRRVNGVIEPTSKMFVAGVDASTLTVNDSIFPQYSDAPIPTVQVEGDSLCPA